MSKLRERDFLFAWAAFVLCATIGGAIAGFFAGAIVGLILATAHGPAARIQMWCGVAGFVAGLPVSYAFFRLFVKKLLIDRMATAPTPVGDSSNGLGATARDSSQAPHPTTL